MYKQFFIILTVLILTSCREAQELKYTTDTLDCLNALLITQDSQNEKQILKILNEQQNKFKFAADLKSTYTDKLAISEAQKTAEQGDFQKAKAILEKRVVERGFSEVLEESLNRLDSAIRVKKYLKNSNNMEIPERAREFAQLKAHCTAAFSKIESFNEWVERENKNISQRAIADKKLVLDSLRFVSDYLSVSRPELMSISLLEIATHESSISVPGLQDNMPQPTTKILNRLGMQGAVYDGYSNNGKTIKDFEKEGTPTFQKQLAYTHLLAKSGQISKTLESLEELQDLCGINENYRRSILKELFLAKGWNDASLINRDFLDISYLLETVYKANQ